MLLKCQPELFREALEDLQQIIPMSEHIYSCCGKTGHIQIGIKRVPANMARQLIMWKLKYSG